MIILSRLLDWIDPLQGSPRKRLRKVCADLEKLAGSHTELAQSHTELAQSHTELAQSHTELAQSHTELGHKHALLSTENAQQSEMRMQMIDRYLSLLQACLTGSIYEDPPLSVLGAREYDATLREYGWDWPSRAHTMIGQKRLANVRALTESVIGNGIPGDLVETGVWRGGACILMRAVLEAYGVTDRCVWLADSFSGLPPPDEINFPADTGDKFHTYIDLAVSLEEVKENFRRYSLLDDQVQFVQGWFRDTLPTFPAQQIALLRLDGDMYESTIIALDSLYARVSTGGYVIVDDFHVVPACQQAVEDFCQRLNISPVLEEIDGVGVYWKKTPALTSPENDSTSGSAHE